MKEEEKNKDVKKTLEKEKTKDEPKKMTETEHSKRELEEKAKLADEYLNRLKYLQAEFDNFRKREESDRKQFVKFANEELLVSLLSIVDDFERAISAANDDKDKAALQMILKRFMKVLEERGVKPIDVEGKLFDPHFHEAFLSEESDKEDGVILEELQKGYMLYDKVIRHSKVKVAKKKEEKSA